jgi:hypothetical protein
VYVVIAFGSMTLLEDPSKKVSPVLLAMVMLNAELLEMLTVIDSSLLELSCSP